MVAQDTRRANGRTVAEEATREVAKTADDPVDVQLPEERRVQFERTGFARMKLEWDPDDQIMMGKIHRAVDRMVDENFGDLLVTMYEIYDRVREPIETPEGKDWKRNPTGSYVEDWSVFTGKERTNLIYRLQMSIVDWTRRSEEVRAEALFAKANWEEAFAIGFESLKSTRSTVQDRENRARLESRQQRYFALYINYYSRVVEGYVRNMESLLLRVSQIHQAASGR